MPIVKSRQKYATGFLIVAILGVYLSLGPSIKVNTQKTEETRHSTVMKKKYAQMSSRNAWVFKYIPGIKNTRAVYRWMALGIFGFWAIVVMFWANSDNRRKKNWMYVVVVLMILVFVPNLSSVWQHYMANRDMLLRIDNELVNDLERELDPGELVAFVPYGNDFLVNYIAPKLDIRTYNIGGDKNFKIAKSNWPKTLKELRYRKTDREFSSKVLRLLTAGDADSVVIPYFSMLWAAHSWPPALDRKEQLAPAVAELESTGLVDVSLRKYFAVVRIPPK